MKIFGLAIVVILGLLLFIAPLTEGWIIAIIFVIPGLLLLIAPRLTGRIILIILGLFLLVWLLIQTEFVQNILIGKVTARLSHDLNTEVKIKRVSFSLFDKMDLNGTLVRDRQKDTLLYAGTLKLRITDWFFLMNKTDLKYIGLEDAVINMHRTDSVWNFQFIIDHFTSRSPKKDSVSKPIVLNIQKIDFKKVSLIQNDEWKGQKLSVKVGSMLLDAQKTDLANSIFLIDSIELDRPYFAIENFDGKRPELPDTAPSLKDTGLYFNKGNMLIKVGALKISNGSLSILNVAKFPKRFF